MYFKKIDICTNNKNLYFKSKNKHVKPRRNGNEP